MFFFPYSSTCAKPGTFSWYNIKPNFKTRDKSKETATRERGGGENSKIELNRTELKPNTHLIEKSESVDDQFAEGRSLVRFLSCFPGFVCPVQIGPHGKAAGPFHLILEVLVEHLQGLQNGAFGASNGMHLKLLGGQEKGFALVLLGFGASRQKRRRCHEVQTSKLVENGVVVILL